VSRLKTLWIRDAIPTGLLIAAYLAVAVAIGDLGQAARTMLGLAVFIIGAAAGGITGAFVILDSCKEADSGELRRLAHAIDGTTEEDTHGAEG
jgi:hypothetical protein